MLRPLAVAKLGFNPIAPCPNIKGKHGTSVYVTETSKGFSDISAALLVSLLFTALPSFIAVFATSKVDSHLNG